MRRFDEVPITADNAVSLVSTRLVECFEEFHVAPSTASRIRVGGDARLVLRVKKRDGELAHTTRR